jgi:hypothetical protein
MRGRGRLVTSLAALLLLGAGIVYAVVPFDRVLTVGGEDWTNSTSVEGEPFVVGFEGECRGALLSATNDGERLRLWAVTVGTEVTGYIPLVDEDVETILMDAATGRRGDSNRFPDTECSRQARERLVASGLLVAGSIGLLYLASRSRRGVIVTMQSDA